MNARVTETNAVWLCASPRRKAGTQTVGTGQFLGKTVE